MIKKKVAIIASIVIAVILLIAGVSYAYYSANLKENNKTETVIKTDKLTLVFTGTNEITTGDNMIPGDSFTKTFTVENTSDVDTKYNIYMENVTNEFNEDLVYVLSDEDGVVVEETPLPETNAGKSYLISDIEIASKELKTYTLKIEYKYLDTPQDDYQGATFRGTVGVDTSKIENNIVNPEGTTALLCKRATKLHEETCNNTDESAYCLADGYSIGDRIEYGSLGSGTTLKSGDAFDCDINGNGIYSEDTERFYYVTDMDTNTAVLIYYSNVTGANIDKMSSYAYNSIYSVTEYYGPQTVIQYLPTTDDWKTTLTNTIRDIKDENGVVRVSNFDYGAKAARLLTYEEVKDACFDGVKDLNSEGSLTAKCKYLMESTKYTNSNIASYGTWLESPNSTASYRAWFTSSLTRMVGYTRPDYLEKGGARPAIEVPKSQIEL